MVNDLRYILVKLKYYSIYYLFICNLNKHFFFRGIEILREFKLLRNCQIFIDGFLVLFSILRNFKQLNKFSYS